MKIKCKNISKKICLIFAIFISMFIILSINKSYATEYTLSDDISATLDSDGTLTVSGTGKMPDYTTSSTVPWGEGNTEIKKVIIDEGITKIGNRSFWECTNLTEVTFPSTLTSIGNFTFYDCTSLTNVTIPDTVTSIGNYAFWSCTNLIDVTLSSSLTSIGKYAFYNCSKLKDVTFPETLRTIDTYAFAKCSTIETVELGKNLLYIREGVFSECTSLNNITIKSNTYFIYDSANTISDTAQICGYKYSSAFYYALYYGRTFVNLNTNETMTKTITNKDYLNALPTTGLEALGPTSHNGRSTSNGEIVNYTTSFAYESDLENEDYLNIKAKTEEIVADCTTETEKAKAICEWVLNEENIEYKYGYGSTARMDAIYERFNEKNGNCESKTMIANYMLYLCGIPTATASNLLHEWSAAFVDGKWIWLDATQGWFGEEMTYNKTMAISFAYKGLVYVINYPEENGKVAGIAKNSDDLNSLTSFKIPDNSYTQGFYRNPFSITKIELIADLNTLGADFIKNNCTYTYTTDTEIYGTSKSTSNAVTSITLDKTKMTLSVGDTATLIATKDPYNSTQSVYFTSSDTSVASVTSEGVITAKKVGQTTITAKNSGGTITATCSVTVTQNSGDLVYTTYETQEVDDTEVIVLSAGQTISNILVSDNFPIMDESYIVEVYNSSDEVKTDTEKVGSKNVIKITDPAGTTVVKEYTVVVKGDVNGDGKVKIYDAFQILKRVLFKGSSSFSNLEVLICDYNGDSKVKMYDAFAYLKQSLFGK